MKKSTTTALLALAVLPMLVILAAYARLPAQVPTHWDFRGVVTAYGSKSTMFLFGEMGPLFALLFAFYIKADPRGRRNQVSRHLATFVWALAFFLTLICAAAVTESIRPGTLEIHRIVLVGVGLLIACTGNMMPTVRSNFFMGVKTPWTLSSDEVWARTHRLAGKIWFVGGLLLALCALLPGLHDATWIFITVLLLLGLVPTVYSYLLYRKLEGK